jgi:hypothetical protein
MDKIYTVIVDSDKLKCYDTQTGSVQGTLTFNGRVINGPVVTGDRVTVVFETASGRQGRIYSLPLLNAVSTFNVS